jgi:hypothetical protein
MLRFASTLLLAITVAACGSDAGNLGPIGSATSPVAGPSGSAAPTLAPSIRPVPSSAALTPAPAPSGLNMGPRPDFPVGALLVTVSDSVRVRSKPRVSDDSVRYEPVLDVGTDMTVLDGPAAGSGYWWYRIHLEDGLTLRNGVTAGWVAAADHDGEHWIDWIDGLTGPDTDPVPDRTDLPIPVLGLLGTEDYEGSDGNPYTRYILSVENLSDYRDELFEPAPDLEPCGLNTSASRTWVDIIDADTENRIYGFCALTKASDLDGIWFAVPQGAAPPTGVYIRLWDRLDGLVVESQPLRLQ